MRTVFVSGCFDVLHGGHVEFFRSARALGDRLVVSVAGDNALDRHKHRRSAIPVAHKVALLEALRAVDEVVVSDNPTPGLDFLDHFRRLRPKVLAVTEDDQFESIKRELCQEIGAEYVKLSKDSPLGSLTTTEIRRDLARPDECPLRVDFAGGWIDVPRFAVQGGYIVNCTVSPTVTLQELMEASSIGTGLGASAALALLSGKNPVDEELAMGVGWQDPAVIQETGLCVWRSGPRPILDHKAHPDRIGLHHRMALLWTSSRGDSSGSIASRPRNLEKIVAAGQQARDAVLSGDYQALCHAVTHSYQCQCDEGMQPLPLHTEIAKKYCGAGFGGTALYLFLDSRTRDTFVAKESHATAIEPFMRFQEY